MGLANFVIWVYLLSGLVTFVSIFVLCHTQFKIMFDSMRKKKPYKKKDLAYFSFAVEGLWSVIGCAYRLQTGERYSFDFIPTLFITVSIVWFLFSAFIFIGSWIKMAYATMGSSRESRAESNEVVTTLRLQLSVTLFMQFSFFMATPFLEELDPVRQYLMSAVNICTTLVAGFAVRSLYVTGNMIRAAIIETGSTDKKMTDICRDMVSEDVCCCCFGLFSSLS